MIDYELSASKAATRESCIGRSKLCWQEKVKRCSLLLTLYVTKTVVADDLYIALRSDAALLTYILSVTAVIMSQLFSP